MDYTEIIIGLRKIVRSINLESKRIQKELGVSIPQLLCLRFLSQCPDFQASQREVALFLKLNSSTVTGIINRLEKRGLLARLPKKGDKRINYITLTAQGNNLLKNTPILMHEKLEQILQDLPSSKIEEINQSIHLLVSVLGINDLDASPLLTVEEIRENEEI